MFLRASLCECVRVANCFSSEQAVQARLKERRRLRVLVFHLGQVM